MINTLAEEGSKVLESVNEGRRDLKDCLR